MKEESYLDYATVILHNSCLSVTVITQKGWGCLKLCLQSFPFLHSLPKKNKKQIWQFIC